MRKTWFAIIVTNGEYWLPQNRLDFVQSCGFLSMIQMQVYELQLKGIQKKHSMAKS